MISTIKKIALYLENKHRAVLLFQMKNCLKILFTLLCIWCGSHTATFSQALTETESIEEVEAKAETKSKMWNRTALTESVKLFRKASDRQIDSGELQKAAVNLIKSGEILKILENKSESKSLFAESLQISKNANYLDGQIKSLGELAISELGDGDLKSCKIHLNKAENLVKISKNPVSQAFILYVSSEYFYYQRDIPQAVTTLKKAVELSQKSQNIEDEAKYLLNLGYAYMAADDLKSGFNTFEKALEKWKLIDNKRGMAFVYVALGYALSNFNEKQKSLEAYKTAESLFPPDIDLIEKARLYNGIGRNYEEFGKWKLSLDYRKKAFDLFGQANHIFGQSATIPSIVVLNSLVYPNDKEYVLNDFADASKLTEKIKDKYNHAIIQEELANYYFRLGDYDNALQNFEKSLMYFQKSNALREIALVETKIAQILIVKHQNASAHLSLNRALEVTKIVKDKFIESEIFYHLARLNRIESDDNDALQYITKSIDLTENLYSDVANTNLKRTYFSNVYERYELYINLLMQKHKQTPEQDFAIQALQASEKSRSRSLLETLRLSEANFIKDANPELVQKEKETRTLLNLKATKLTELLSSNAEKAETDALDSEINALQNELEDIKGKLKTNSPVYSAIKNPPSFDVAGFQQNVLDDKTVLLEFSLGEKESYLWLVGKTEISHFVLPSRDELESRIEKIRQTFDARQMLQGEDIEDYRKRTAEAETVFNRETRLLSDELFGQIADKLTDKRLIIVPDGKLALLPISALPFPNSDEPFILRNEIVYQPSASLLNILPKIQNHNHQPGKDLLVFADPVFNRFGHSFDEERSKTDSFVSSVLNLRDFRLTDANGKIPRLFATQEEADSIAEAVGKSSTEIASGFAANREKVLNSDISDYRILHFATHGFIDVERPEISSHRAFTI